jgi:hypothetical protein
VDVDIEISSWEVQGMVFFVFTKRTSECNEREEYNTKALPMNTFCLFIIDADFFPLKSQLFYIVQAV